MARFMYVKFKDQMEEARALSYLGGRSAAGATNSFISQDDGYSGLGSE